MSGPHLGGSMLAPVTGTGSGYHPLEILAQSGNHIEHVMEQSHFRFRGSRHKLVGIHGNGSIKWYLHRDVHVQLALRDFSEQFGLSPPYSLFLDLAVSKSVMLPFKASQALWLDPGPPGTFSSAPP